MAEVADAKAATGEDSGTEKDEDDRESEFAELDPMKRYGRYPEVLGRGAFKTVYRAFDEVEGIEVAWNQVKVQDILQSPEDLERLYSEVHLLKTLKHKNIIKFYSSWVDAKTKNVNFITEIFTSGTLRQYRQKHKHCDLKAVKNWARQILRGLLYLHSHDPPIIHRDLKCDNIFVNGNQGEVKIGDLGLAAILRKSQAHSVIGTPEFMAPELYEEEYNELVDIYSFGMCLIEMLTFEYPYSECANAAQIYKKVTSGKKPAALDKVKDPEVKAFVEKCLATASRRLPARELLMDSFLKEEHISSADLSLSRIEARSEELEALGLHNGPISRMVALAEPSPLSGNSSESDSSGGSVLHKDGESNDRGSLEKSRQEDSDIENEEEDDFVTPELLQTSLSKKMERMRSSRDFKVKGKKSEDDDRIYLRLRIVDDQGQVRNIHFPFDTKSDTAFSVASEMVAELDLTDQDVSNMAEMIDTEIMMLVPDWRPGVAVDEGSERESNFTGGVDNGEDTEDERENQEEEEEDPENMKTVSSMEGMTSPSNARGRSFSPLRSQTSLHSQRNLKGPLMSPSRVFVGAASPPKGFLEGGVSHGRFWEGFSNSKEGTLLPFLFSSDENDESRKISTVPEDDALGDDEADEPPRNSVRRTTPNKNSSHSQSDSMKGGSSGEDSDSQRTGGRLGRRESEDEGSEDSTPERAPADRRMKSLADMSELYKASHPHSPVMRLEHSKSEDVLTYPRQRAGPRNEGSSRFGGRGGEAEGEEEDVSEEERLLVNRVRELEELEKKYREMLEDVRSRHKKIRDGSTQTPDRRRVPSLSNLSHSREQVEDRGRNVKGWVEDNHRRNAGGGKNGYHAGDGDKYREMEGRNLSVDFRNRDKERDRIRNRDRASKMGSPTLNQGYEEYNSSKWVENPEEEYGRSRREREQRENGRTDRQELALSRTLLAGKTLGSQSSPSKFEHLNRDRLGGRESREIKGSLRESRLEKPPPKGAREQENKGNRERNYSDSLRDDYSRSDSSTMHRSQSGTELRESSQGGQPRRQEGGAQGRGYRKVSDYADVKETYRDMDHSRRSRERERGRNRGDSFSGISRESLERERVTKPEGILLKSGQYFQEESRGRREYEEKMRKEYLAEYYEDSEEERESHRGLRRDVSSKQDKRQEWERNGVSSSSSRRNGSKERLRNLRGECQEEAGRKPSSKGREYSPEKKSNGYISGGNGSSEDFVEEQDDRWQQGGSGIVRSKSGIPAVLPKSFSNKSAGGGEDDAWKSSKVGKSNGKSPVDTMKGEEGDISTEDASIRGSKTDTEIVLGQERVEKEPLALLAKELVAFAGQKPIACGELGGGSGARKTVQ